MIWTLEEHLRGDKELLVISKGNETKGTIEIDIYEEKVAWQKAIALVNSILTK